jgi:hypothetical protein
VRPYVAVTARFSVGFDRTDFSVVPGTAQPALPDFANPLVKTPADVTNLLGEIDNEASSSA